jgi:hypothetical protein
MLPNNVVGLDGFILCRGEDRRALTGEECAEIVSMLNKQGAQVAYDPQKNPIDPTDVHFATRHTAKPKRKW